MNAALSKFPLSSRTPIELSIYFRRKSMQRNTQLLKAPNKISSNEYSLNTAGQEFPDSGIQSAAGL